MTARGASLSVGSAGGGGGGGGGGPPSGAAGGSLAGTYPNPDTRKLHGHLMAESVGSPADGAVLVNDASANLGAGAYIATLLGNANIADDANISGSKVEPDFPGPVAGQSFHGQADFGLCFAASTLSIAGTGPRTLTGAELITLVVELTGALTGARALTLPAVGAGDSGADTLFVNSTTSPGSTSGPYPVTVQGPAGDSPVWTVPVGQSIRITVDSQGRARCQTPSITFAQVQSAIGAATGPLDLNGQQVRNAADPSNPQDLATKNYVDGVAQGLDAKASVLVATTTAITLSGTQTIDGVSVPAGARVLVKDQSTASQNGLYLVASGAWTRTTDANTSAKVTSGLFTFVEQGTTNADSGWVLITDGAIVLDTTALSFTQFSGAGQITAGAGLTKSGNRLDVVANADGSIIVNTDDIQLGTIPGAKWLAAAAALTAPIVVPPAAAATLSTHLTSLGDVLAIVAGTTSVSIAGSGSTATVPDTAGGLVLLTGARTADVVVTVPSQPGRRRIYRNDSTGLYLVKLVGAGGAATYLLPGQSKQLWVDSSNVLQGEGDTLEALFFKTSVDMASQAINATLAAVALPAGCAIDLCEAFEAAATTYSVGGSAPQISAGTVLGGTSGIYDDVIVASTLGTINMLHGKDKTKLGSLMVTDGYGFLPAASTLRWQLSARATTGGTVRPTLRGRWLGP